MPQHAPIQRGFNYIDWAHALPVCAELKNRLVEMAYLAGLYNLSSLPVKEYFYCLLCECHGYLLSFFCALFLGGQAPAG